MQAAFLCESHVQLVGLGVPVGEYPNMAKLDVGLSRAPHVHRTTEAGIKESVKDMLR